MKFLIIAMLLIIPNLSQAKSVGIRFPDKYFLFFNEESDYIDSTADRITLSASELRYHLSHIGTDMIQQNERPNKVLKIINTIYSLILNRENIFMVVLEKNPQEGNAEFDSSDIEFLNSLLSE